MAVMHRRDADRLEAVPTTHGWPGPWLGGFHEVAAVHVLPRPAIGDQPRRSAAWS